MFRYKQKVKNSSEWMETNPFIILKVTSQPPPLKGKQLTPMQALVVCQANKFMNAPGSSSLQIADEINEPYTIR